MSRDGLLSPWQPTCRPREGAAGELLTDSGGRETRVKGCRHLQRGDKGTHTHNDSVAD